MRRTLFLLAVIAMLASGCKATHYTVYVWAGNSKIQRQVCVKESMPLAQDRAPAGYYLVSEGCEQWGLIDRATIVGYIAGNQPVKCTVAQEFYDNYAENAAYQIPADQCRVISPATDRRP